MIKLSKFRTYGESSIALSEFGEWAQANGIEIARSGRIQTYISALEKIQRDYISLGPQPLQLTKVSALYETELLLEAWDQLRDEDIRVTGRQWTEAVKGTSCYTTEGRNRNARNELFNLMMLAHLKLASHQLKYDSIGDGTSIYGKHCVLLECKRVNSIRNFRDNIQKASDQLTERFRSQPMNSIGLIAIDVTALINPGFVVRTSKTPDIDIESKYLRIKLEKFVKPGTFDSLPEPQDLQAKIIRGLETHPRILAVMLYAANAIQHNGNYAIVKTVRATYDPRRVINGVPSAEMFRLLNFGRDFWQRSQRP